MTLLSNAKWNMSSQLFKVIVQAVNIIYLAKIIPPNEYGLMAMALVIFNLGVLLRDLGTSAAIIQRKKLTNELINTVFWLNVLMGVGLCIFVILLSPLMSEIYHQPKLVPVLILLSITFPLSSCAAAHLALLERDSKFKIVSLIEITSASVSVIVAIILAKLQFGVYSLVAQAIIINLMSAIQFWIVSPWRPFFSPFINIGELKNIFGFSANLSLFNFINYFSRNADSFIIGRYMSASILGNYNLAYRIMLFPLQSLTYVTTRSLYPILSKNQDDNKLISSTYISCVFFILLITAPLMSGLAYYSDVFVDLVFGEQWYITADVLKWLAPTAIIQSVLSTTGAVFMAKGRTDTLLRLGIIGAILQVGAFIIGVNFTIRIFAICYLVANILNSIPVLYCIVKVIDADFNELVKKIYPIFISTIFMLIILNTIGRLLPLDFINSIFRLIIVSFIGAFLYFASMTVFSSYMRVYLLKVFNRLRKK